MARSDWILRFAQDDSIDSKFVIRVILNEAKNPRALSYRLQNN